MTGSGTAADPWTVVTTMTTGTIALAQTFTYVAPREYFDIAISVVVPAPNNDPIKVYYAVDSLLGGSDDGPAFIDPMSSTLTTVGVLQGTVFMAFIQRNLPWTHWVSGDLEDDGVLAPHFNTPGSDYPDTANFDVMADNGFGLQWDLGSAPGTYAVDLHFAASVEAITFDDLSAPDTDSDGTPDVGTDSDGDGMLDAGEVLTGANVCNGVGSLVETSVLDSDPAVCPAGGIAVRAGSDANGNGTLDTGEYVDRTVCNGDDSLVSVVSLSPDAAVCPTGGFRFDVGRDLDGDGTLDPGEIGPSQPVCNGAART